MRSMQSPVLAFDPEGRLKLLNAAGEQAFGLQTQQALYRPATELRLDHLLETADDGVLSLETAHRATRWMVKRTEFRLRGIPHTLFVLSDVSVALREGERLAWERLIRVLGRQRFGGHETSVAGAERRPCVRPRSAGERHEPYGAPPGLSNRPWRGPASVGKRDHDAELTIGVGHRLRAQPGRGAGAVIAC